MKNDRVLRIVIAVFVVLVCLLAMMGYFVYRDQIFALQSESNHSVAILNGQIVSLQSQNAILQTQNSVLNSQISQIISELEKTKNLKTFASVEELRSFVSNNAGYNFVSGVYDSSDSCIKMMMAAKNQGYWMGLMPKQIVSYYNYNNYDYYDYSNTPWINEGDTRTYRYFNYSSPIASFSYGGVINVTVVGGRDLYTVESGAVAYVGSMSVGF